MLKLDPKDWSYDINNITTYDDAFKASIPWIWQHYKGIMRYGIDIEVEDYFQECALRFYERIVPRYVPQVVLYACKQAYLYVMYDMIKKERSRLRLETIYTSNKQVLDMTTVDDEDGLTLDDVILNKTQRKVAQLLIEGLEPPQIADVLNRSLSTVHTYTWEIRKAYAQKLGITNYKGKCTVPHKFVKTEKRQAVINAAIARNKSKAYQITCNGETHSVLEWSEIFGIKKATLKKRIEAHGYEQAIQRSWELKYGKTN